MMPRRRQRARLRQKPVPSEARMKTVQRYGEQAGVSPDTRKTSNTGGPAQPRSSPQVKRETDDTVKSSDNYLLSIGPSLALALSNPFRT